MSGNSLCFMLVGRPYSKFVDLGEPVLELKIYTPRGDRGGNYRALIFLRSQVSRVVNIAGLDKVKNRVQFTQKTAGSSHSPIEESLLMLMNYN